MAYTKNTWASGDVVTSAKLNNIENGIASGGVLVVNAIYDEEEDVTTLDKTWAEIYASPAPILHFTPYDTPEGTINVHYQLPDYVTVYNGAYIVSYGEVAYSAEGEDGYPNDL